MKKTDKEWYVCRIKYRKQLEEGILKRVTEVYVVQAISVSDAEKKILQELAGSIESDSAVTSVKEAAFKDLFRNESERFYLCKTTQIIYDEESCKEKKTTTSVLVQADNFKQAVRNLETFMKGTCDYNITSIVETFIVDIL